MMIVKNAYKSLKKPVIIGQNAHEKLDIVRELVYNYP